MSDLKTAIDRLVWRFNKGQSFKPNEYDTKCLNAMINFINVCLDFDYEHNVPYTKLYLILLREYVHKRKDIEIAAEELNSELKSFSVDYRIDLLKKELTNIDFENLLAKLDLKPVWEVGQKLSDIPIARLQNREILAKVPKAEIETIKGKWQIEDVEWIARMYAMEALNLYKKDE